MNRRHFISVGAKAFVGVAVGAQGLSWLAGCATNSPTDPSGIWKELAKGLSGTLYLPDAVNFAAKSTSWALQYSGVVPQGIVQCLTEADVVACVNWAKSNKIEFVARSGGHSYAAYSSTKGLLIDLSLMNSVVLEPNNMARLGGGARNRDVYAALRPVSLAITHGRCKNVGVAGLVLGGGIGFNMRAHGLTCDRLISTRIVTANGDVLNCSATENQDLFWAVRGAGGGNLGIHTEFVFEAFPVTELAVFSITWTEQLEGVFTALQAMAMAAPNTLGLKVSVKSTIVGAEKNVIVNILGQLVGSESELASLLSPVYAVAQPSNSAIQTIGYWDGQEFLSEEGDPEYSHERSRFAFQQLNSEAVATIFRNVRAWPGTSKSCTWKFFLMGGVIDEKLPNDTAFVHRRAKMVSTCDLEWSETDSNALMQANRDWLNNFHNEMQPYTSSNSYQNFIDRLQTDHLNSYYGSNLEKLMQVKKAYDGGNLFNYPQSIPPA